MLVGGEEEIEVGADYAESLIDHVGAVCAHHDGAGARVALAATALLRNLADEGHTDVLDIVARAHLGVEVGLDDVDAQRDGQGYQHGYDISVGGNGLDGSGGAGRLAHHLRVIGLEGLCELVLLALLEQEEIEALLDLLLALHAEQVVGLAGGGCRPDGC